MCIVALHYPSVPPGRAKSKIVHRKQERLVRFEQDCDLPDAVCHEKLKDHMPANVTMNKIYQKLFIG